MCIITMDKVDEMVAMYPHIWKTRSAVFSWIKGGIRRLWNHSPVKLDLLKKQRRQIPNPNVNGKKPTVWGATCAICGKDTPLKDCQIDHVVEETASLTKIEDIQSCAEKLLLVTENDLRILCSDCHSVVSLSQRLGITFEQALLEKEVIAFKKLNAEQQKKRLTELGIDCIMFPTMAKRVDAYRNFLKENTNE